MNAQKYVAEVVGTFVLALAVSASLVVDFPLATPLVAALALGLGVYTLGGVSGAHFNPAITLGMMCGGKISMQDAGLYLAAQVVGAILALQTCLMMFGAEPSMALGEGVSPGVAEMLGAAVFGMGVAAAVKAANENTAGLVVGGSLLLGIMLTGGASAGILNPAVSLAVGGFENLSLTYILAPIAGAAIGMFVYSYVSGCCGGCTPKTKGKKK